MDKGHTIKVLDHGYVKFIDSMGTDQDIIEAARMSTGRGFVSWNHYKRCKKCDLVVEVEGKQILVGNECSHDLQDFPRGDLGTLDYLWRHKHATPFEMCELVIEVQAPIFVFREWHRHRTQSFNEFSARYSMMQNLHYVPEKSRLTPVASSNKQESSASALTGEVDVVSIEAEQHEIYEHYEEMISAGVPKEIARVNTPVSRYSKMRAKTDLRNWLAFLNLRMRPNAQWEIRQFANVVGEIVRAKFPKTWELFEEYDLLGVTLSRSEIMTLRDLLTKAKLGTNDVKDAASQLGITGSNLKELFLKLTDGGESIL